MRKKENNRHWGHGEGRFILLGLSNINKSTESFIKETLTTTLISNMKKKLLFATGVRQLCMMNFGISAVWILLYVRFADFLKLSVFFGKSTDILRPVKSSIAS